MSENATFSNSTELVCLPGQKEQPQHVLYQLANICFIVAYLAPSGKTGLLFMHAVLILGFFLFSMWAWNVICLPDIFSWNFFFVLLNLGQLLNVLYTMRKVKFPVELEDLYRSMFQPWQSYAMATLDGFRKGKFYGWLSWELTSKTLITITSWELSCSDAITVSRLCFKKLVSPEFAQMVSLHPGEAYAMENLTRIDRLGLLISGRVHVLSGHHFLHHIQAKEFLDSPEFESSRTDVEEKFKVTIVATSCCRCLVWQRQSLVSELLIKETHLSNVLSLLLSRDITRKLYAMNDKMVTEKGSHLDIRLPSLTGSIASNDESKLKETKKRSEPVFDNKILATPPISDNTPRVFTE